MFSSFQTATNSASAVKTVDGEEVERVEEGVAMREEVVAKMVEQADGKVESQEARLVEMEGERREGGEVVQHRREEQFTETENSVTKVESADRIEKQKDEDREDPNFKQEILQDLKNSKVEQEDGDEDEDLPPPPPSVVEDFPPPPPTDETLPPPVQDDEDDLPPPVPAEEDELLPPPVTEIFLPPPEQDCTGFPGGCNEQPLPPTSLNLSPNPSEAQALTSSSSPTTAPASSSPSLPTSSSSASYLALVSPTGFAPRPDETEARKAFTTRYQTPIFLHYPSFNKMSCFPVCWEEAKRLRKRRIRLPPLLKTKGTVKLLLRKVVVGAPSHRQSRVQHVTIVT